MEIIFKNKKIIAVAVICLSLGYFYGSRGVDLKGMNSHEKGVMNMDNHEHKSVMVSSDKVAPKVSLETFADTMGGYNIHIITSNYIFTPKEAGKDPVQNTGHVHVFVNGVKVGRAYGEWYYIPKTSFNVGMNTINVYLTANNHSNWMLSDGKTEIEASKMVEVK